MTARPLTHPKSRQRLRPWTVTGAATLATTLAAVCAGCTPEPAPAQPSERAVVSAVVDGDTFKITTASGAFRVRIIGIDTPETGRDGAASECYAEQARDELDQLIYGRTVELFTDPTQAETDKYGRLLRHVYVDDVNVALTELEAGAGREYTYDKPYAGQDEYRAAQRTAAAAKHGQWGTCPTGSAAP